MIARIWNGRTNAAHLEAYTQLMKDIAIPDYKKTPGFIKLSFLSSVENGVAHFKLITYWENLEVIENFAGTDYEIAKYYPEDEQYLLEFEEKVSHFEVFSEA